jgi:SAM-dependent methyltransferase
MSAHDNLEDYLDPVLYDQENSDFEPDGPFYLALAQKLGGRVLELGCGTGRITIPMAEAGVDITGLDIVPGMLARARDKAGDLPIEWVEGDVCDFHLGRKFSVIIAPGNVFEHLLKRSQHEAMLACVREHLAPDGCFALVMRFPRPAAMQSSEGERDWFSYTDESGREVKVTGTDEYDIVRQVLHETAYRRWTGADGETVTRRARLSLRFFFPQEIQALLHYNGFRIYERYGDLNSNPMTAESRGMVMICGKGG